MGWTDEIGMENDIVLNTAVKIIRNAQGVPFTSKISHGQAQFICDELYTLCTSHPLGLTFDYEDIQMMSPGELMAACNKYMIPIVQTKGDYPQSAFFDANERCAVFTNIEDHVVVSCVLAGLQIQKSYSTARNLCSEIKKRITFEYNSKYGYLTANPSNVGTGLKVSLLMHLPSLTINDMLRQHVETLRQKGISLKNYFSANGKNFGSLYQLSNMYTLGVSEDEIIEDVSSAAQWLISLERDECVRLFDEKTILMYDVVWRSAAVLSSAWKLSLKEFFNHISNVRLGARTAVLKNIDILSLNELLLHGMSGYVHSYSEIHEGEGDDIARARVMREEFMPLFRQMLFAG